jgi:hypothetical protein
MSKALARVQCAAITRGCGSFLVFPVEQDVDLLGQATPGDREAHNLLTSNGWRLDHGRWICGLHPVARPVEDDYAVIPPAGEPATTGRVILHREEGSGA